MLIGQEMPKEVSDFQAEPGPRDLCFKFETDRSDQPLRYSQKVIVEGVGVKRGKEETPFNNFV